MRIQLSDHFNYSKLLKFVLPSILMMICTSIYGVVDGLFVSNFVGKTHFAAVNLIIPFFMGIVTVGFMIGTGGSAIVAKTLGEGKKEKANEYFTMLICLTTILGIIVTVLGQLFLRPIITILGAKGILVEYCVTYGRIVLSSMTAFMLQTTFQSFFIVAEKPELSLKISIASGITNMILDFVFIAVFHWGLVGAAVATMMGQIVGGVIPIFYFAKKNNSLLRFTTFKWNFGIIFKTCTNDDKSFFFCSKHIVQLSAYEISRRKWYFCIWCNYVCQFYICSNFYRLFYGKCPHYRLSLWCGKSFRITQFIYKKHSINCNI